MGTIFIENFVDDSNQLFNYLKDNLEWDTRMKSRSTASFGIAYNYSGMKYPEKEFIPELENIATKIESLLGWKPNNCLLNYYPNGNSKMGYHSDNTDILAPETGVVIISIGTARHLDFKHKELEEITSFNLTNGSLFYMDNNVQDEYLHAINESDAASGRISLTFRKINTN